MNNNFNFHQTFPPSAEYLMRLLEVCDSGESLTKEEISEQTGIPTGKSSGKVEPHISYAEYMGLANDHRENGRHLLSKTLLGKELLIQDPGMQEKISLAVCHARITSNYDGAVLWATMFKSIFPNYPDGISDSLLSSEMERRFSTPIKVGPFLSSYSGMFGNLSLLAKEGNRIVIKKQAIDWELLYVYAYALLFEWEHAFPDHAEITSSELASLRIAETFGLNSSAFYSIQEMLNEKKIIRFNRQLAPYTIIKLQMSSEIIPLLFSELC